MEVTLHVYNLSKANKYISWMGLGAYHTGVTVGQKEYTFSPAGIVSGTPRNPAEAIGADDGPTITFRESIELGSIPDIGTLNATVSQLRTEFSPGSYDLISKNCNHFSHALVKQLLGKSIPAYINRSARFGHMLVGTRGQTSDGKEKSPKLSRKDRKLQKIQEKQRNQRPELSDKQRALLAKLKTGSNAAPTVALPSESAPAAEEISSASNGDAGVDDLQMQEVDVSQVVVGE